MPTSDQHPCLTVEELITRLNSLGGTANDAMPEASVSGDAAQPAFELDRGHRDLVAAVEASWLQLIVGEDEAAAGALGRRMAEMRLELGWEKAPLLERLLIDRVVLSWVQIHHADLLLANTTEESASQAKLATDRLTACQKRHQLAIAALRSMQAIDRPAGPQEHHIAKRKRPRK